MKTTPEKLDLAQSMSADVLKNAGCSPDVFSLWYIDRWQHNLLLTHTQVEATALIDSRRETISETLIRKRMVVACDDALTLIEDTKKRLLTASGGS